MGAFPLCSAAGFILAVFLKALKPQAYPSTQLNHSNRLPFGIYPPFPRFSNQMQAIFSPLENVTLQLLQGQEKKKSPSPYPSHPKKKTNERSIVNVSPVVSFF